MVPAKDLVIRVTLRDRIDRAVMVPAKDLAIRVTLRGRIDGAVLVFAKDLAIGVAPRVRIDGVVMLPAICKGACDTTSREGQKSELMVRLWFL